MTVQQQRDNLELVVLAQAGDTEAREQLAQQNAPLVWSMVHRMASSAGGHSVEMEDLFQIGCIGLLKAADKFDASFGVQFSTYAVPMILGEMRRFLRDDGMVKVSRTIREQGMTVGRTKQRLTMELGREPSIQELSEGCQMPVEEVVMALEAAVPWESLSTPAGKENDQQTSLQDRLPAPGGEGDVVDRIALRQAMQRLDERERAIICARYFEEKTQCSVAQQLGISQVQVSRLERKILKKMRGLME